MKNENMQVIYIKRESKFDDTKIIAMLNGKYNIEERENGIKITKEHCYLENIWGNNITDCFALVGENGSGKTQIMNMIMDLFYYLKNTQISCPYDFFVIFENTQSKELLYYYTKVNNEIKFEIETDQNIIEISKDQIQKIRKTYKVGYVHNALSRNDYLINQLCDYNFSLGGLISHDFKMNADMKYSDVQIDKVINYFDKQQFQIIDFIYKFNQKTSTVIPLPLPKIIEISFTDDRFNWDYIVNKLKKLRWDIGTEEKKLEKASVFERQIHEFFSKFKNTWVNKTIRRLVINCFKEIVVPQRVPAPSTCGDCEMFWNMFSKINKRNIGEDSIIKLLLSFW